MHPVVGSLRASLGWTALQGNYLRWRHFGARSLDALAREIRTSEARHCGQLVLAVEAALPAHIRQGRERALEVFGRLRVWDTEARTGMLLYLALGDHCIELVTDRGVQADPAVWGGICRDLQAALRRGDYAQGLPAAIAAIEAVMTDACPLRAAPAGNPLPDRPVLL